MEGRADTEKDNGDKETNKGIGMSPWMEEWIKKKEKWRDEERQRLKGCVMERRKGYIIAAGLCVNVVSTLEAICCDNDKILTLEWRKCSVSRTNDWGYGVRDTEGDSPLRNRERETFFITKEKEIKWGIHHSLAKAVGQNSHKRSPPTSTRSSPGCVTLLLSVIHHWAWEEESLHNWTR